MAILYFAARAVDHRSGAWQSSSVAAALMIVARPLDVRDAGFILTFGATLALLEGVRMGARLRPRIGALSWVAASVVASLAVEIALLPVSATLFSRVTGAGLVLNLLAVPLMGVVQIAALAATLADPFPSIAGLAGWISHAAAHALVGSASLVTLAPWSTARVPSPPVGVVAAYYLALAALIFWKSRLPRVITGVALVAMTLVITGAPLPTRPQSSEQKLRLTMFDVGQGESTLAPVCWRRPYGRGASAPSTRCSSPMAIPIILVAHWLCSVISLRIVYGWAWLFPIIARRWMCSTPRLEWRRPSSSSEEERPTRVTICAFACCIRGLPIGSADASAMTIQSFWRSSMAMSRCC